MKIYKLEFKGYTNDDQIPIISLYDLNINDIDLEHIIKNGVELYFNSSSLLKSVYINIDYNNTDTNERYYQYERYFEYVKTFKRDSVIDGILG